MKERWLMAGLALVLVILTVFSIFGILFLKSTLEVSEEKTLFDAEEFKENKKLLLQEAEKSRIGASEDEVEKEIKEFLKSTGQTEEELSELLEEQDTTAEEFREDVKDAVKVKKLLDEELKLSEVTVTDEEVAAIIGVDSGTSNDLPDDELALLVHDEVKQRLLLAKKAALINEYLEGIDEGGADT